MRIALTLCAGLLLAPASVFAHGKATGIVMERMELMDFLGAAMKTLKSELALGGEYDAGKVVRAAGDIRKHSGEAMTRLFPKGSTKHSEALPSVWEKPEQFEQLAEDLAVYAGAMQIAAQTRRSEAAPMASSMMGSAAETPDAATLATLHPSEAFKAVAEICSSCHSDYRMKKK